MRILVVEDEPTLAGFLAEALAAEGYSPLICHDGLQGEVAARADDVELVILDLTLPGRDGLAVLSGIRAQRPDLPVVVLTARDDVADRVRGLDLGADDYMGIPFSLEELLARVRVRLRGAGQPRAAGLTVGLLTVDLRTRRVTHAGREIGLTAREYALLVHLMRHPDHVLSRPQLLQAVWGLDFDPGTKIVDVYIGYLRRKLRACGVEAPIETVRHVGYRLRAPRVEPQAASRA